jgi:hypothetical protein
VREGASLNSASKAQQWLLQSCLRIEATPCLAGCSFMRSMCPAVRQGRCDDEQCKHSSAVAFVPRCDIDHRPLHALKKKPLHHAHATTWQQTAGYQKVAPHALMFAGCALQVLWRPSQQEGSPRRVGPVRFRQHYCPNAGIFTGALGPPCLSEFASRGSVMFSMPARRVG